MEFFIHFPIHFQNSLFELKGLRNDMTLLTHDIVLIVVLNRVVTNVIERAENNR